MDLICPLVYSWIEENEAELFPNLLPPSLSWDMWLSLQDMIAMDSFNFICWSEAPSWLGFPT